MVADALDPEAYHGTRKQIGWFPLTKPTNIRLANLWGAQPSFVLHWHGAMFNSAKVATLLASSDSTQN